MPEEESRFTMYTVAAFTEPAVPSLRMARDRVWWASKRLTELAKLDAEFDRSNDEDSLVLTIAKAAVDRPGWAAGKRPDFTIDWSGVRLDAFQVDVHLLGSEVINHCRTALDYVAFNLAWLDAGRQYTHTKFPLVTSRGDWSKERRRGLRGVTAEHVSVIEAFQPFSGCTWSRRLRDLSNSDKHRFAVALSADQTVSLPHDFSNVDLEDIPGQPDRLRIRTWRHRAEIVLPDRAAAIPALETVVRGVADVIVELQRAFGESFDLMEGRVPV